MRFRVAHTSLNTKLFLIIIVSALVPLSLCLAVLNHILIVNASNSGLRNMCNATDIVHTTITSQTEAIRKNALLILRDSNIRQLLQETADEPDSAVSIKNLKTQASNIIDIVEDIEYITSISIYVNEDHAALIDQKHYHPFSDITDSAWYRRLTSIPEKSMWIYGDDMQGDLTSILPSSNQHSLSNLAYVTKIVSLSDYRQYEAILRIDYSTALLQTLLDNSLVLPGTNVFLLDKGGHTILDAGPEETREFPSWAWDLATSEPRLQEHRFQNKDFWEYSQSVKTTGWNLVTVVPSSTFDILASYGAYLPLIIALLTSCLLVFIVCLVFSHSITSRIRIVSKYIRSMQNQREFVPLPSNWAQDEITELFDSYSQLAAELQQNLRREYLLGISKRTSDLHALRAQINPHFLYNTLEMIGYYAYEGPPELVEKIVSKLAQFYKLSLNHGEETYLLWQEIQLINSYFDIQCVRYNNKISMEIDIPTEFDQCQIPPITLQPLVENAINHGIRQKADKTGRILLTAYSVEDRLVLTLKDDGVGMSAEQVTALNQGTQQPILFTETDAGSHYGIMNINQRLKLIFGNQYGLSFSSSIGEGSVVTVTIPL